MNKDDPDLLKAFEAPQISGLKLMEALRDRDDGELADLFMAYAKDLLAIKRCLLGVEEAELAIIKAKKKTS